MAPRRPDLVSLIVGLAFLGVSATVVAGRGDVLTDAHWAWPLVLVVIGTIMLLATLGRGGRHDDTQA
jgi:hypothetical protein